jgi:polygalacturonase
MAIGSEMAAGVENVFVDNCHFDHADSDAPSNIQNILFVKTNERRGGFVKGIYLNNVTATKVAGGVLSIDTDVLYQWRNLVPTVERRLTRIEDIHVSNVTTGEAKFLCEIKGEAELPVKNVTLKNIKVAKITGSPVTLKNVEGFVNQA